MSKDPPLAEKVIMQDLTPKLRTGWSSYLGDISSFFEKNFSITFPTIP